MILHHEKLNYGANALIERVTIKPPFRLSLNFPNDACFIFFDSGSTRINAPYEQVPIGSKEAVLLRCGTYFAELLPKLDEEVYEILVFHLPRSMIKRLYEDHFPLSLDSHPSGFIHKVEATMILREFIRGLGIYFTNTKLVSEELLMLKIRELILILQKTRNHETLKSLFHDAFSTIEVTLKEVVHSHLFTDCTVEDLALLCNMSLSTFKRHFKKIFDDTPTHYFKSKRLDKAKDLLKFSDLTISEIAHQTCFYDAAHFSKSYREKYGVSPSDFRKKA